MRKISDYYSPEHDDAQRFDFSEQHVMLGTEGEWDYRYNTWEAYRCESTDRWIGSSLQGETVEYFGRSGEYDELDPTRDQRQQIDDNEQTPTASYWWPMGHLGHMRDPWEAAWRIRNLPVVLVEVDGEYGFALTGGGMDMSWYLAGAFVACGFLPPLALAPRQFDLAEKELGKPLARRVRTAYREALRRAQRRIRYQLAEVNTWR